MNERKAYTFIEKIGSFFNLVRDWEIVESKEKEISHYNYNWIKGVATYTLQRCSLTGKERGYVYYSKNLNYNNHSIDKNEVKVILNQIK